MKSLALIVWCIALSIVYGIVHDQITVRMCLEYFTVAHPPLGIGENPTTLALAWGVIATWWVGLFLGVLLAVAARAGSWPKLEWRDLRLAIVLVLVVVFVLAMMSMVTGWVAGVSGRFRPPERIAEAIPYERWKHFHAAAWAHTASYAFGALGGLALCGHALLLRWRRASGIGRGRFGADPSARAPQR